MGGSFPFPSPSLLSPYLPVPSLIPSRSSAVLADKMPTPILNALPSGDRVFHWRALTTVLAAKQSPMRQFVAARAKQLCPPATAKAIADILQVKDAETATPPAATHYNPCLGCGLPSTSSDAFGLCIGCGDEYEAERKIAQKGTLGKQPSPGTCDLCSAIVKDLAGHVADVHEGARAGTCDICGAIVKDLKQHINFVHQGALAGTCDLCGAIVRDLAGHVANVHEGFRTGTCNICKRAYKNLKKHIKLVHQGVWAGTCDLCGLSVKDLKSHIKLVHEGATSGTCDICKRPYKDLKKHIRKVHKNPRKH
ncbi:hypothetical protein V8E36_003377 [Tilletia maclaganii]